MMYVSDHGENLLDDERMLFLHATYAGSIYEYHVPMFIWYSDSYGELYPEHIEQLKAVGALSSLPDESQMSFF